MTPMTTLNFNIPTEEAELGVSVGLYSNTDNVYLSSAAGAVGQISAAYAAGKTTLPLITMAQNGTIINSSLVIPATQDFKSGELFIFVGDSDSGLPIKETAHGPQVSAAKAAACPITDTPSDNFTQIEFNYQQHDDADGTAGLDIDTSAVNSTGFPVTIVYPDSANVPYPLSTLGITVDETDLNANFQAAFSDGVEYSDHSEFEGCATYAQVQNPQNLQVVSPQDVLSAEATPPNLQTAVATSSTNGHCRPTAATITASRPSATTRSTIPAACWARRC